MYCVRKARYFRNVKFKKKKQIIVTSFPQAYKIHEKVKQSVLSIVSGKLHRSYTWP